MNEQNEHVEEDILEIEEDYSLECNRYSRLLKRRSIFVLVAILVYVLVRNIDVNYVFNPVNTNFFAGINIFILLFIVVMYLYRKQLTQEQVTKKSTYRTLRIFNETFDLLSVVPYLMCILTISNAFFFSFSPISGTSMEPNFSDNETVVFSHIPKEYERFDVVILYEESLSEPYLIKRVIGLPGENVTIQDNKVYIDGELLEQNFIDTESIRTYCTREGDNVNYCTFDIEEGSYFVLGDNRDGRAIDTQASGYSIDSRMLGPIEQKNIYGRVVFKFKDYNLLD